MKDVLRLMFLWCEKKVSKIDFSVDPTTPDERYSLQYYKAMRDVLCMIMVTTKNVILSNTTKSRGKKELIYDIDSLE